MENLVTLEPTETSQGFAIFHVYIGDKYTKKKTQTDLKYLWYHGIKVIFTSSSTQKKIAKMRLLFEVEKS